MTTEIDPRFKNSIERYLENQTGIKWTVKEQGLERYPTGQGCAMTLYVEHEVLMTNGKKIVIGATVCAASDFNEFYDHLVVEADNV